MSNVYIPRCLPFHDWDEWISVKDGLYSNKGEENDRAIQTVELWRSRGRVPHSADSTAQIVEALYCPGWRSDMASRQMFSTIIIRTVNGLVDSGQQGQFAESIVKIAEQIGLPSWIVDVRYDATHNQLPTLAVLKKASETLLQWLFDNYWLPQYNLLLELTNICLPIDLSSTELIQSTTPKSFESYVEDSSPTFLCDHFLPAFTSTWFTNEAVERNILEKRKKHWISLLTKLLTARPIYMHAIVCRLLYIFLQSDSVVNKNEVLFWSNEIVKLMVQLLGLKSTQTSQQNQKTDKVIDADLISQLSLYYPFVSTLITQINNAYPKPHESVNKAVGYLESLYTLNMVPTDGNSNSNSTGAAMKRSASDNSVNELTTPASTKKQKISASTVVNNSSSLKYSEVKSDIKRVNTIGICDDFPVWSLGLQPGQMDCNDLLLLECVATTNNNNM